MVVVDAVAVVTTVDVVVVDAAEDAVDVADLYR